MESGFAINTINGSLDGTRKRVFAKDMHTSTAVQVASCATIDLDGGSFKMENGYLQTLETFRSSATMIVSFAKEKITLFHYETHNFMSLPGFRDRILVTGGTRNVATEVHDIKRPSNLCGSRESLERYGAVGGILEDQIIICGGKSSKIGRHQSCTVIGEEVELNMNSKRYAASSVVLDGTHLWITGMKNTS